ncbi:aspartate dehydrogenase [Methanocaldococcus fervens]|uniref:L-aspartate dehydrogenase n=1 Tax=Methanocaldococcus fervens (strain DSM 4213 / JCM 15782 / AG86) TaxID=573064 RepID=C7P5S3_METFA|nr:aspartate dehydrogenase [Methanocaldococcus fervens]ACV23905.1 Aspartate dehydrogenase [Methanocaldococcus fervens AG86]
MFKIGIVGCGAIGSFISKKVLDGTIKNTKVVAVYDKNLDKMEELSKLTGAKICKSVDDLVKEDLDLVVEAASVRAVEEVAEKSLTNKKDVLIMSVGALVDKNLFLKLQNLAKNAGKKIYLPSGAIGGLDAIKAMRLGKIKEVILKTTKPVNALEDALKNLGYNVKDIKEPVIVFEGDVFEAIKEFPANINVSVTLSIAAEFPAKVMIVADPNAKLNKHEVIVKSSIGKLKVCVENVPFEENPRTSALAAYSAVRLIRDLAEPIKVGT